MRSRVAMVALAGSIFIACKGQQGPLGPAGLSVGDGGTATTCQAGTRFCEGTGVWECSRVGLDAVLVQDCQANTYYASANNPYECSTTHCGPYDYGACCNSKKPTCVWSMTNPVASTGTSYRYTPLPPTCYTDRAPVCAGTGGFYFYWSDQDYTVCQASARYFYLSINRSSFPGAFPKTISLGTAGLSLGLQGYTNGVYDSTKSCSTWTGTVTWTSDDPTWSVTINATSVTPTCAAGLVISGTFNGDV